MTLGFTAAQHQAFGRIVRAKRILDVGAGPYAPLAVEAMRCGAAEVVALDKDGFEVASSELPEGVKLVEESLEYFAMPPGGFDLILLSWPWIVSSSYALETLMTVAPEVLYLGKNTEGIRCGSPTPYVHQRLWQILSSMRVVEHVPALVQVLIHYDGTQPRQRAILEEEEGALAKVVMEYKGAL